MLILYNTPGISSQLHERAYLTHSTTNKMGRITAEEVTKGVENNHCDTLHNENTPYVQA